MTNEVKQQIATRLKAYMTKNGLGLKRMANLITGVSPATLSMIASMKWEDGEHQISNQMWNMVGTFLKVGDTWVVVNSMQNYKRITRVAKDCQAMSVARAISAGAGLGKSTALRAYAEDGENVFYIECKEHWNRKVFLNKIRQAMAMPTGNESVSEIAEQITSYINKINKPLIIFDEADKLRDTVVNFFVSLYNDTHKSCGYLLTGSIHFKKAVDKCVAKNKLGYAEFYSRLGREFIELRDITPEDVRTIAEANGITDDVFIKSAITEIVVNRHNDLRRLERMINDYKKSRK